MRDIEPTFVFAVVNLLGSVMFLIGIATLYSDTGSLDMRTVAERTDLMEPSSVISIAAVIFAAFFLKLGLFPFHFWRCDGPRYVGEGWPAQTILPAADEVGARSVLVGAGTGGREMFRPGERLRRRDEVRRRAGLGRPVARPGMTRTSVCDRGGH